MTKKVIAIIPARAGSKGIPNKNIMFWKGKPLFAHAIEEAKASEYIDEVIVTSDSEEYLEIAKSFGAQVIKRPDEIANDNAPMVPVILHSLENSEYVKLTECDTFILLQPTSPLRKESHISDSIRKYLQNDCNSLISVVENDNCIYKSFNIDGNHLSTVFDDEAPFKRRQDFPKTYIANGALYICNINSFIKQKSFFLKPCIPFVMEKKFSVNLDTPKDIAYLEETDV